MLLRCYIVLCAGAFYVSANRDYPEGGVDELLGLDDFINRFYYTPEEIEVWLADLHAKEENITSQYRPDMTQHRERILGIKEKDPKTSYLDSERECLKAANKSYSEKLEVIHILDEKIREWRKFYKYLSETCTKNHPNDQDTASQCLTESITQHMSDTLLRQLYYTKLDGVVMMPYHEINRTIENLEKCLSSSVIEFWDHDKILVCTLNTCYNN